MKIIIDKANYNLENDSRVLIPYIVDSAYGCRIGFASKRGNEVIKPYYSCAYDDFFSKDDVIVVGMQNGYHSKDDYVKLVIDSEGNNIFKELFRDIFMSDDRQLFSVENRKGEHAVLDRNKNIVVPYGKYDWIDGFRNGFARVKIGMKTNGCIEGEKCWGIINAEGKEILPVVFPNIHRFVDDLKNYITIEFFNEEKVESQYVEGFYQPLPCPSRIRKVYFDELRTLSANFGVRGILLVDEMRKEKEKYQKRIEKYNACLPERRQLIKENMYNKPDYDPSGKYDYNKAAREQIPDAYEGDSDARWNTD